MNSFNTCNSFLRLATFAFALGCGAFAHAGDKSLPPTETVIPKSVFVDDANHGKDPFFPNSTRRLEALPRIAVTNTVSPVNVLWDQLFLKGISGTKEQRLALINSATVAEGELAELRVGQHILKLRCREIRERSVLIELVDSREIRELKLREGI